MLLGNLNFPISIFFVSELAALAVINASHLGLVAFTCICIFNILFILIFNLQGQNSDLSTKFDVSFLEIITSILGITIIFYINWDITATVCLYKTKGE